MTTSIEVKLTDGDLHQNVDSLLHAMNKIREESIAKGSPQNQKEYQQLAYRMSTCFQSLYDTQWDGLVDALESAADRNPLLARYDRFQLHYWKEDKDGKTF